MSTDLDGSCRLHRFLKDSPPLGIRDIGWGRERTDETVLPLGASYRLFAAGSDGSSG
jgi:hypothetical protein